MDHEAERNQGGRACTKPNNRLKETVALNGFWLNPTHTDQEERKKIGLVYMENTHNGEKHLSK
jgi:hypothetical protein